MIGGKVDVEAVESSGTQPPGRVLVIPFYDEYDMQVLPPTVVDEKNRAIDFPGRFMLGLFAKGDCQNFRLLGHTPTVGYMAFAPDYWPAAATDSEGCHASRISLCWPLGKSSLRAGAFGTTRLVIYPRERPWNVSVAANTMRPDTAIPLAWYLDRLFRAVDSSASLKPQDRLMIYTQLVEVTDRAATMNFRPEFLESWRRQLYQKMSETSRRLGCPPLPAREDDAAWLAIIQSDLAAKGLQGTGGEWMALSADAGRLKCVEYLFRQGVPANTCFGPEYPAPLYLATRNGHLDVARALIAAGADVNATSGRGDYRHRTLDAAAQHQHTEMVRLLLDTGAEINATDFECRTALHRAACNADVPTVRLLLERSADFRARARDGSTPLHEACRNFPREPGGSGAMPNTRQVVELLLEAGADGNATDHRGETPLHVAIAHWADELVPILVKNGADVNLKDEDGLSPLGVAQRFKREQVRQFLKAHGAEDRPYGEPGAPAGGSSEETPAQPGGNVPF
jgi:ankyrin repeat protein